MINIINDFKTIQIAVYLTDLDKKDTSAYRFLLPKLMSSHTDQLDSRMKMSLALENLYGAYFKIRVERFANLSVMSIIMTMVDPGIVKDPGLLESALNLFKDVLFSHKMFSKDIFEEEKRMLVEQWETLEDKKRLFAQTRFYEHFFEGDLYAYPLSGTKEDVMNLDLDKMMTYYQQLIQHSPIKVVVNGPIDDQAIMTISRYLDVDRPCLVPFETSFRKPRPVKYIEETTHDLQQAIVKLGYHFGIFRHDDLYNAAVILEIVLGGYPESRLFKEIREDKGLCYDIGSNYDYYKGVLMIAAGIEKQQVSFAVEEIKKMVETMKEKGISDEELLHAKAYYTHQIKTSLDSQSVLTKRAFIRDLLHYSESVEDRLKEIQWVTLQDVNKALNHLILDTVYVLKGDQS
jgi:predicted Zn-dependent peptidase